MKVRITLIGGGSMIGDISLSDLESDVDFIVFTQPNGKQIKLNKKAIAYVSEE